MEHYKAGFSRVTFQGYHTKTESYKIIQQKHNNFWDASAKEVWIMTWKSLEWFWNSLILHCPITMEMRCMKFMDSTKTCLLFLILAVVDVKYLLSGLGYWLSSSLSNSNYFTLAIKCLCKICIINFTSAKMKFASAIFKKNVFFQIFK